MNTPLPQAPDIQTDSFAASDCPTTDGMADAGTAGLEDGFPWHRIRRLPKKG